MRGAEQPPGMKGWHAHLLRRTMRS